MRYLIISRPKALRLRCPPANPRMKRPITLIQALVNLRPRTIQNVQTEHRQVVVAPVLLALPVLPVLPVPPALSLRIIQNAQTEHLQVVVGVVVPVLPVRRVPPAQPVLPAQRVLPVTPPPALGIRY